MTNPPPDEPAEAAASPDPAAAADQPASSDQPTHADRPAGAASPEPPQPAPAPPPVAPAPAVGGYFGGPPYPPGMSYPPFAPVARPPRMPWVNPARRGLVAGIAAAVAVVLLGGGIGIGIAIAPSGNHHGPRFERGDGGYPGLHPGQFGRLPNAQFPHPAPSSGSSATPSSSPTR